MARVCFGFLRTGYTSVFSEKGDDDEQMGDVENPEDKQKSETFGENEEKLVSQ